MVRLALRGTPVVLDCTLYVTVPLPEPLAPPVIVNQPTGLEEVQLQPAGAVTPTLPVYADGPSKMPVADRVYVQTLLKLAVTFRAALMVSDCGLALPDKSPLQ